MKYIKDYAKIAHPLNNLLRKETTFQWSSDCNEAFIALKDALVKPPILTYPKMDWPFILTTNVSTFAISYILGQKDDNN